MRGSLYILTGVFKVPPPSNIKWHSWSNHIY